MAEMTQVEWRNHIARQKAKRKQQIEEAKAAPEVKEAEAPEVTEESVEPTTDAKMEDAPVEVVEKVAEEVTEATPVEQASEAPATAPEVEIGEGNHDQLLKVEDSDGMIPS